MRALLSMIIVGCVLGFLLPSDAQSSSTSLAVAPATSASAAEEAPTFVHGIVTKLGEEGKSFELKGKEGKFEVTPQEKVKVWVHDLVPIGEVEEGTELFVLGRYTKSLPGRQGGTLPPSVGGVIAIVTAPKKMFEPPTLDRKLKQQKYQWVKGKLRNDAQQGRFVGETLMTVGPGELVIKMRAGKPDEVGKKKELMVWGKANVEDPKAKTFVAEEFVILARVKDRRTYPAVIDFTGKYPPSTPPEKRAKENPDFNRAPQ